MIIPALVLVCLQHKRSKETLAHTRTLLGKNTVFPSTQKVSFQLLKIKFVCGQHAEAHTKSFVFQNTSVPVDLGEYRFIQVCLHKSSELKQKNKEK